MRGPLTPIGTMLPLVLAGLIVAALGSEVARDAVNVPSWDHWGFATVIADAREGRLDPAVLWRQHNEHRAPVPRLLILGLAMATDWDVRFEVAATFVLGMVGLALLAVLAWRSISPTSPAAAAWSVLGITASLCTMKAWQHWLWGWQVHAACNVAATILVAWLLAHWTARWRQTAILVVASALAALSFASGLMLCGLLPVALFVHPGPVAPARRRLHAAAAAVAAAAFVTIYLTGYVKPKAHPSLATVFVTPLQVATYALAYLGSVLGGASVAAAAAWGAGGSIAGILAIAFVWWRDPARRVALVPWCLLAAYALGSSGMTAVGRAGFGAEQALAARYGMFSGLFWAGILPLVVLAAVRVQATRTLPTRFLYGAGVVTGMLAAVAVSGWLEGWTAGATLARKQRADLRWLRPCLLHVAEAPDACLARLYPSPPRLRAIATRLAGLRLGPFADWRPEASLATYRRAATNESAGELESIALRGKDDTVEVRGWAVDPVRGGHAHTVLVTSGDDVLGRAWTGLPRPRHTPDDHAGFDLRIRRFRLAGRSEPLRAWVVLDDGSVVPTRGALAPPASDELPG